MNRDRNNYERVGLSARQERIWTDIKAAEELRDIADMGVLRARVRAGYDVFFGTYRRKVVTTLATVALGTAVSAGIVIDRPDPPRVEHTEWHMSGHASGFSVLRVEEAPGTAPATSPMASEYSTDFRHEPSESTQHSIMF
jgi:hypothetical protein